MALAIGVVLVAAVIYLSVADLSTFRPNIERAVSEATGRQFTINGPFELDVLPEPSVVVEGATLANAEWGSDPTMVQVGHLSVRLGLWSLLFGPIEVREFRLRDVNVLIETSEEGAVNTEMGEPAAEPERPTEPAGDAELPVLIEFAEIRNVTVTQRAPDTDDQTITIAELTIQPDDAGKLGLTGSGSVLGLALGLGGEIGPLEELQSLGAVDYKLDGNLGSLSFGVEGRTEELESFDGTALTASLATGAIEELLQATGGETALSGPLKVDAEFAKNDEKNTLKAKVALANVTMTADTSLVEETATMDVTLATLDKLGELLEVADLPQQELKANGSFTMAPTTIGIDELLFTVGSAQARLTGELARGDGESRIDVDVSGSSLAELRAGMPEIPFTFKTTALMSPARVVLDPLTTTFGESDLNGNVNIANGTPSEVDVKLQSQLIDMTPFYEKSLEREKAEIEAEQAQRAEQGEQEPESRYVFTEDPFALDGLRENDIDVDLSIARLLRGTIELLDIQTVVDLHDGKLDVDHRMSTAGSGASESKIMLDAAGQQPQLDMLATFKGLKLNLSSGENADVSIIPPIDLTLDIKAAGPTPRAMASSTNGRFVMTQGRGRVENKLVGRVSGDLFSQLFGAMNPMAEEEQYSNWECSVFGIEFVDGDGEIKGLLLQGPRIQVVGGGTIDLNTEKLNIEFNTKPREGAGLSADMFVTPFIKVGGTLASPGVGLNKKGVLLSGGAAIMTGGLSFLYQGLGDRASSGDLCEKTLAEVGARGAGAPEAEPAETPGE
jgi:uncharacterized protein involved in outer membrane biogenesis